MAETKEEKKKRLEEEERQKAERKRLSKLSGAEREFEEKMGKGATAQDFIQQREQRKSELMGKGYSESEAEKQFAGEFQARNPEGQLQREKEERAELAIKEVAEEKAEQERKAGELREFTEGSLLEEKFPVQEQTIRYDGKEYPLEEIDDKLLGGEIFPITDEDLMDLAGLASGGGLIAIPAKNLMRGTAARLTVKKTGRVALKSGIKFLGKGGKALLSRIGKTAGTFTSGVLIGGVLSAVGGALTRDLLTGGAEDLQQAINTVGDLSTGEILDSVRLGMSTPAEARADLDFLEADLEALERKLKAGKISGMFLGLTGKIEDIDRDILERKKKIALAREQLIYIQIEQPDTIEMSYFIAQMRDKYDITRDDLRSIKKTILE